MGSLFLAGLGLGIPNWAFVIAIVIAVILTLKAKDLSWAILIICGVLLLMLAGCQLRYENDNGPRGPERWSLGGSWPKPLSCRGEPVAPVEKAP